jgi:hypothetical protein
MAEENGFYVGLDGRVALVAGEEARSREAGQDTEMATRHLVPPGAAH